VHLETAPTDSRAATGPRSSGFRGPLAAGAGGSRRFCGKPETAPAGMVLAGTPRENESASSAANGDGRRSPTTELPANWLAKGKPTTNKSRIFRPPRPAPYVSATGFPQAGARPRARPLPYQVPKSSAIGPSCGESSFSRSCRLRATPTTGQLTQVPTGRTAQSGHGPGAVCCAGRRYYSRENRNLPLGLSRGPSFAMRQNIKDRGGGNLKVGTATIPRS